MDKQVTHLHGQALNPEKSLTWLQTQGFSGSTSGTRGGSFGVSPAKHRRRGQKVVDAAAGGGGWISEADRKRRFEGVLWYQDMSRVCPGCPQTTPMEARQVSCIRDAYGEHPGANAECRMKNAEEGPVLK